MGSVKKHTTLNPDPSARYTSKQSSCSIRKVRPSRMSVTNPMRACDSSDNNSGWFPRCSWLSKNPSKILVMLTDQSAAGSLMWPMVSTQTFPMPFKLFGRRCTQPNPCKMFMCWNWSSMFRAHSPWPLEWYPRVAVSHTSSSTPRAASFAHCPPLPSLAAVVAISFAENWAGAHLLERVTTACNTKPSNSAEVTIV